MASLVNVRCRQTIKLPLLLSVNLLRVDECILNALKRGVVVIEHIGAA